MKNRLLALTAAAVFLLSGCNAPTEEAPRTGEESRVDPADIYPFIESEYTLCAEADSSDIAYNYTFYFVDGVIGGAKSCVTFPEDAAAEEFYLLVSEDHEYVDRSGNTVTFFITEEDDPYWVDYSIDELEHGLLESGYSITYNFDKDEYLKDISEGE